jgi:endonuclease YncB( thermonuclease family)
MKTAQIISILSLLFLFCSFAEAKTVQGRVTGITDGDTIKVVVDREQESRVKSWLRLGNVAQSSGCESRLGNR